MHKLHRSLIIALAVVAILTACGGGEKESGEAGASTEPAATSEPVSTSEQLTSTPLPEPTLEQATETAAPEPTTEPPVEEAATPEPTTEVGGESTPEADSEDALGGLLDLSSIRADPKELTASSFQSYRLRATWTVEAKQGGGVPAQVMQIEMAHVSDPPAEEISFSDDEQGFSSRMIHIGDRLWIESGEQWIEVSSDELSSFDQMLFSLDSVTTGLAGDAKLIGQEDLNDVETQHYSFDENILGTGLGIYSKIKGDVWVSAEDGYVIKYTFTAEDDEATYQWDWEVYDINAPFTIEPPAEAQGARDDIPLLPDATDRASFGPMTSYQTASDMKAVIDFYQAEMPALGWAYDASASMVMDQFATLAFSKEGTTVNITLGPGDPSGTAVLIQAGE